MAVVGVGLIGGSVALAAHERLGAQVTGYDSDAGALSQALAAGVIQEAAATLEEAVRGAETVFVSVPVGSLDAAVGRALDAAGAQTVITDVGSTKRAVVAAHPDPRFVGGHPLAGAETSGVGHARADLFDRATWYLTPTATTSGVILERLFRLLRELGACPEAIDSEDHDRLLATVSHLPHVFANVLVTLAAEPLAAGDRLPATGPSFRDATRVAGAPSAVWTDIYLSNREALGAQLDQAIRQLSEIRRVLAATPVDRAWISAWNDAAADHRRRLTDATVADGELVELRASVPNRPGVMAEVALALGRAGVNIADLALHPAADLTEGVVALWIGGEATAARAERIVGDLGFPVARA